MELLNPPWPLILSFLLFIFMVLKRRVFTQNQATKLPPGPWRLPIIGNMHQLIGSLPHQSLRDLANKHGPLMHLRLGQLSTIVVSSPAVAMEIMKTHDLNFADRPRLLAPEIVSYGCTDVVFAPYGNYWRQLRKICMLELFSAKRVESFRYIREEEVSNLIQSISNAGCSRVNLTEKFHSLINNIVARAVFGTKCNDQEAFLQILKEALLKLLSGFYLGDIFPSLKFVRVITGMKFRLEHIHQKFDRILNDIIEAHKAEKTEDKTQEDLVDVLLRIQKDGDSEFPLTTDNIKSVILDMFSAGTESSSTTMGWAMAELMRNPIVMEKAQVEVRQLLGGKSKFDESDTNKLHYLKSVLKETLRLHPPIPLLRRECRQRCEIQGYEIPIKTRVLINVWAIGRDPKYWEDAERFKPERFDGSEIDYKGCNFDFIPFGAGRRMCPGLLLGVTNSILPLAQLLYYYDWKLPDDMKPEELDMDEAFGLSVGRKNNLHLIPVPHFSIPMLGC